MRNCSIIGGGICAITCEKGETNRRIDDDDVVEFQVRSEQFAKSNYHPEIKRNQNAIRAKTNYRVESIKFTFFLINYRDASCSDDNQTRSIALRESTRRTGIASKLDFREEIKSVAHDECLLMETSEEIKKENVEESLARKRQHKGEKRNN